MVRLFAPPCHVWLRDLRVCSVATLLDVATLDGHQHLAPAAHVSDGLVDQGLGNLQGGLPEPLEVLRPGLLALGEM